ncbi:protein shisa-5-like isoform X2 [Carassius carassius]|uniref:protein shisa-5-like isoform X2 n=1 Tax=Carassius carassius TaxID=217509 RepID=UPI0028686302|nr:protein shisa-5-like isoform X2 [Carassius carassius]
MASASAVLLFLSAGLFTVTDGFGDDCKSYFTSNNDRNSGIAIGLSIAGVVVFIVLLITCCCCPCCCIYQMCRKPRPAVQTHVTTVMNTQSIQPQPVMQGGQYPQYQPVPTQAGYGGQPMQTGPYQGQSYAPGPPPSYHVAMSPGYPTIQGGQAMYPMQPPAQPGAAPMLSETSKQPAYNPAYMQPPNTGY